MTKESSKSTESEVIYQAEVIKDKTYDHKVKFEARETYYNVKEKANTLACETHEK